MFLSEAFDINWLKILPYSLKTILRVDIPLILYSSISDREAQYHSEFKIIEEWL